MAGAYERAWDRVGPRLAWAACFAVGERTYGVLSAGTSGDLAYTVALAQAQVRLVGQDAPAPIVLRVTQLYRREEGVWKLIHWHADPIVNKTDTAAVLSSARQP
jgi:ketosteroid isomerase-like protein